jgi:hypothetical protein
MEIFEILHKSIGPRFSLRITCTFGTFVGRYRNICPLGKLRHEFIHSSAPQI